jgi:hypothetical protein
MLTCIFHRKVLAALPDNWIPFGVDWKPTSGEESTLSPEQMSVDGGGIETEGTRSGPCTFAVHSTSHRLTGDEYGTVRICTLKAKTLEHLKNKGQTLGFGHSSSPQSMFNNIQLFPQMFPWLFPYGLGGLAMASIRTDSLKLTISDLCYYIMTSGSRLTYISPWWHLINSRLRLASLAVIYSPRRSISIRSLIALCKSTQRCCLTFGVAAGCEGEVGQLEVKSVW